MLWCCVLTVVCVLCRGQLPSTTLHAELTDVSVELIYENVKYRFKITKSGPSRCVASVSFVAFILLIQTFVAVV